MYLSSFARVVSSGRREGYPRVQYVSAATAIKLSSATRHRIVSLEEEEEEDVTQLNNNMRKSVRGF